jgi:hypothetical protein
VLKGYNRPVVGDFVRGVKLVQKVYDQILIVQKEMEELQFQSCMECESNYLISSSKMGGLCPDCAHWLYGYENCAHDFKNGSCRLCHWNGKTSSYVLRLRTKPRIERLKKNLLFSLAFTLFYFVLIFTFCKYSDSFQGESLVEILLTLPYWIYMIFDFTEDGGLAIFILINVFLIYSLINWGVISLFRIFWERK